MKISSSYISATILCFLIGVSGFCIGLWNANMPLHEKGYYLTLLLFGLFAAISVQKSVRDIDDHINVSSLYMTLAYSSVLLSVVLITFGLINATLTNSEKGFYGISFVLSLFCAVTIQKNVRDQQMVDEIHNGKRRSIPQT